MEKILNDFSSLDVKKLRVFTEMHRMFSEFQQKYHDILISERYINFTPDFWSSQGKDMPLECILGMYFIWKLRANEEDRNIFEKNYWNNLTKTLEKQKVAFILVEFLRRSETGVELAI